MNSAVNAFLGANAGSVNTRCSEASPANAGPRSGFADNARGEAGLGRNSEKNERLGKILVFIGANEA
jgi:hypothetical protein